MRKEGKKLIFIIVLIIIICANQGWDYTIGVLNNFRVIFEGITFGINQMLVLYQTSVLELLLTNVISFSIVGYLFGKLNIPKGTFGHYIGCIFYFIISAGTGFVLGKLSNLLFSFVFFTLSSHLPHIMVL